ncbi:hypothetical protein QFC21_005551 [Naganishia friedmannii]|uniref:Uncharacterized protein n=1 Tax=Naganishia friedmannii TaxID=89922 RepID=A0ACC2V8J3_9TREE|nr:hypothetical protein QFC21_005551 [Naganishia friedmannii]
MTSTAAPLYRKQQLNIACVQYDPQLKDVQGNIGRVKSFLRGMKRKEVDLLVCPEMALTGYMFTSGEDIKPFLEHPRIGPTALFCRELATTYGCWVIAGYPELAEDETETEAETRAQQSEATGTKKEGDVGVDAKPGYNSAVIVSPSGEVVGNYRKSFLYDTDKTWAREGDGFKVFDLPPPLGRTAIGICMGTSISFASFGKMISLTHKRAIDMNPKDFLAPFDAYELANYVKSVHADTLVVPMNWLDPPQEPPDDPLSVEAAQDRAPSPDNDDLGPEMSTLNYWAHRLMPLHDPAPTYPAHADSSSTSKGKEVVFVACNRVGTEQGTTFVGSSTVLTISSDPSRIELIEAFGRKEQGVMFATVH